MNKRTQNCSIFRRKYWSSEADYGPDVQKIAVQFTARGGGWGICLLQNMQTGLVPRSSVQLSVVRLQASPHFPGTAAGA